MRIAFLFFVLFLATVDNQLLLPLIPTIADDLGSTAQLVGLLVSGYALSAALFNIFLGPLTDRWGRVPFLRIGLVLLAVNSLLAYQAPGVPSLLVARLVAGLAGGLLSTCTASYVGDNFPYEKRGRVMGIVLSSYFAAVILGLPAGAQLAMLWGWRSIFIATAGLAAVLFLVAWRLPRDRIPSQNRGPSRAVYWTFLKRKDTRAALAASFLVSGATVAVIAFISPYLSQTFGLDPGRISIYFLISGVAALVGSPLAGWLCDRWTKRAVFLLANTALAPLVFVLTWPGITVLPALVFAFGLAIAFRQTALQTLQTHLVDTHQRGQFIALRNGFSQLGIAASVSTAGVLFEGFGYAGVTLLGGVLTLAGSLVLYLGLRRNPVA